MYVGGLGEEKGVTGFLLAQRLEERGVKREQGDSEDRARLSPGGHRARRASGDSLLLGIQHPVFHAGQIIRQPSVSLLCPFPRGASCLADFLCLWLPVIGGVIFSQPECWQVSCWPPTGKAAGAAAPTGVGE